MKSFVPVLLLLTVSKAIAFSSSWTIGSSHLKVPSNAAKTLTMEYIPSGLSKEQWKKIKEKEQSQVQGKNLGKVGITTFKSRSFVDWQKSGGKNLFPVDPKKVKDPKQIPYMQRPGGSADDSDLTTKKNPFGGFVKANKTDKVVEPEPQAPKKNWWTLN